MNRWIRRGVVAAAAVAALAATAVAVGYTLAEHKVARRVDVKVAPVAYRADAQSLERGRYLYASRGCVDCHGADGKGRVFVDDGEGLKIAGPNISPGPGSVVAAYTPQDWVRAIRHGVKPDGRPLLIMPSEDYNRLTDDDLAALVAHVRGLPPAAGGGAVVELPLPVRVLYGYGLIRDAADKIDHTLPPSTPVAAGLTVEHGKYVASMCIGCHGPQLAGGKIPGGPPDWPAAANLTPGDGGVMGRYPDAASMARMFRTGHRPDGGKVAVMPFESLREMNDVDVGALWMYLRSLPPARSDQ